MSNGRLDSRLEDLEEQGALILAAEDCPAEKFSQFHRFLSYEERIIRGLMAHGPVLLRGGRGSGKSALLIEAHNRLQRKDSTVFSVYLSLRHLPLLRSKGVEYERRFCGLLIDATRLRMQEVGSEPDTFFPQPLVGECQQALVRLSSNLRKRVVLFFDDAAHLGRETALTEFFDIFRTLSSSSVSCKAAIYPGVTKFGIRFDVYNDSTVIEVARDERSPGFGEFFLDVLRVRYPSIVEKVRTSRSLSLEDFASLLGRAVVGNMRAFVFACNRIGDQERIGLPELTSCMLALSADYYWPLLDELAPKLGIYEPLIEPSRHIAEKLFAFAGNRSSSVVIHRDLVQGLGKPLEILEYAGFLARREVSRGMKSGGRGSRYTLNLCNLLEVTSSKRLTSELMSIWLKEQGDPAEVHSSSAVLDVSLPNLPTDADPRIFSEPVSALRKSPAYPYGLTDAKIETLLEAGIQTVGHLAEATDAQLMSIQGIGPKMRDRIRNVVGQAIWM